jgi:hypothetical protein
MLITLCIGVKVPFYALPTYPKGTKRKKKKGRIQK